MKIFRGDSFNKTLTIKNYQLKQGDKIKFAILRSAFSENVIYEDEIEIEEEVENIELNIPTDETKKFPVGELLFEIELSCENGIIKTTQYTLEVLADGIK